MQNHAPIPVYRVSDQAVDGLLRGLAAGVAMILFLALATALAGRDVVEMLASLAATESARPFNGVLSHLAVSAVFGIVWGVAAPLLLRRTTLPLRLWGMLYALPLYSIAQPAILPGEALVQIPAILFLFGHFTYGVTLGVLQSYARPHVV